MRRNRWRQHVLPVDIDSELTRVARTGGGFMTPGDPYWPGHFACLGEGEPMGLWSLGNLPGVPQADHHLSTVGARTFTGTGDRYARNMATLVTAAGVTVMSGGAIGIDTGAHRGALSARERTICIFAEGMCNPYPTCHGNGFRTVIDGGGAPTSEVVPVAKPARWRFLIRNRLVAAWSGATMVVETGVCSGALATARRAMEYGRGLGVAPGAADAPMSVGCPELARNGATIIRDECDTLELMRPVSVDATQSLFGMSVNDDHGVDAPESTQRRIWEALPRNALAPVEAICIAATLSREEVDYVLMELSVTGLMAGSTCGWT